MTALTLYLANAPSSVLSSANKLYTIANAGTPPNNATYSVFGVGLGWVEIAAQGHTTTPTGIIGTPSGKGFFLDGSLAGNQLDIGNYAALVRLNASQFANGSGSTQAGTLVADLVVRTFRYNSISGVYTLIKSLTLLAQNVTNAFTTFSIPASATSATTVFAANEYLYSDIWGNVTTNNNANPNQGFRLNRLSMDTAGLTGDAAAAAITTPGFSVYVPPQPPPPTTEQYMSWVMVAESGMSTVYSSDGRLDLIVSDNKTILIGG